MLQVFQRAALYRIREPMHICFNWQTSAHGERINVQRYTVINLSLSVYIYIYIYINGKFNLRQNGNLSPVNGTIIGKTIFR